MCTQKQSDPSLHTFTNLGNTILNSDLQELSLSDQVWNSNMNILHIALQESPLSFDSGKNCSYVLMFNTFFPESKDWCYITCLD